MQNFIDTKNQNLYAFEDDVVVTLADGVYSFVAAHGEPLNAPVTLQPHTPAAPSAPTAEELQAAAIAANEHAIQSALDAKAQSRGYRSITSACAYASPSQYIPSTDPTFATCEKFRIEGNALQSHMMRTWATAYAYLATVEAGTNPMPTPEQAVAMMPTFTWPD